MTESNHAKVGRRGAEVGGVAFIFGCQGRKLFSEETFGEDVKKARDQVMHL